MFKSPFYMTAIRKFEPDNPNGGGQPDPSADNKGDQVNPAQNNDNDSKDDTKADNQPAKKYTDDDVNKLINEKFAKWKADEQQKLDEAKKLSKMNADQKTQYELEQAKKERDEAKNQIAKFEMTGTARKAIADENINVTDDDLSHIVTADAESTQANVDWLKDYTKRIRDDMKQQLLTGGAPKIGGAKLSKQKGNYGSKLAEQSVTKNKKSYFKN
ncbi:MAG TPA: hypothetical protein DDW71_00490 [Lactobacillus sp.]|nr:hypothetical protein [Lactobacillus sp.]